MVLYQMDLTRFITVYIVQLGMGLVYLFIGLLIIKRSRKRLNQIFSYFYFMAASAAIVNVIYAPLKLQTTVKFLNVVTIFLFSYAVLYLFVVCLIIWKSETVITVKRNNIIALVYFILLVVLFPIAFFADGVTINESTDWKPVWSFLFVSYLLIVVTSFIFIPLIYVLIRVYGSIEDKELKKRWLFFILGILPYFAFLYLISVSNFLNDPTFRIITSIIGLFLFPSAFLLYYSIVRHLEK